MQIEILKLKIGFSYRPRSLLETILTCLKNTFSFTVKVLICFCQLLNVNISQKLKLYVKQF